MTTRTRTVPTLDADPFPLLSRPAGPPPAFAGQAAAGALPGADA